MCHVWQIRDHLPADLLHKLVFNLVQCSDWRAPRGCIFTPLFSVHCNFPAHWEFPPLCCGSGSVLPHWVISEQGVVPSARLCYLPSVLLQSYFPWILGIMKPSSPAPEGECSVPAEVSLFAD